MAPSPQSLSDKGDPLSDDTTDIYAEEVSIRGGVKVPLSSPHHADGTDADIGIDTPSSSQTQSTSLGERIQGRKSVVTLKNLITPEEIDYLVHSSLAAAASQTDKQGTDICKLEEDYGGKVFIRMPTVAAAKRHDATDALPEPMSVVVEQILERTFRFIDERLCPSIKTTMLGFSNGDDDDENGTTTGSTLPSLAQLFNDNQLEFSIREPAINVYTAPHGHFAMHKDGKDFTILIALSDPNHDFTGGGTAFWSQSFPHQGMDDPSLVLAPPPGTAILFGGKVSHKAMHIRSGTRVVIVASFNRPGKSAIDTY